MGESLRHYVIGIKKYIAKLEKADFPNLKKDKAKLLKIAKQETSLKDGDIFMPSMDFTGGGGTGKYSYKCQPRYAIWAYAPDSVASMTCEFDLDKKQAKAPKSSLFICAQDDDSDKKCKISISINGHEIFKGENDFGRFKWDLRRFEIPASYLVEGKNILTVTNTEESDNISGPPFFMISYAALVF
jgi:hypothetical protein